MNLTWTIVVSWLTLQLPLGMLVGTCIKLGMGEPVMRFATRRRREQRSVSRVRGHTSFRSETTLRRSAVKQ
jgi:hypothetical protein